MTSIFRRRLSAVNQLRARKFSSASVYDERKQKVLDAEINCMETLGGSQNAPPIFFLPGAFGSIEMDFKPIIPHLNKEKYKWISWDPPGYGKSRPPKREFVSKHYEGVNVLDVKYTKELMNMFGYKRYTLLAWSGAALTGIIIASDQPETVSGLITWGAFGYVAEEMIPGVKMMKKLGLNAIPDTRRAQLLDMYGEEYLLEMWNGWCDEAVRMVKSDTFKKGGTFQETIQNVRCPSLVIHGMKDALIDISQANHLVKNLGDSKLHTMEKGTHNLHLRETKEFVKCVEDFVDRTVINSSKL